MASRLKRTTSAVATPARSVPGTPAVDIDGIGDVIDESLTAEQIAKALRVSKNTVIRWWAVGVVGRDGRLYRLPSFRIGRRGFTRRADLNEFLAGLNAGGA